MHVYQRIAAATVVVVPCVDDRIRPPFLFPLPEQGTEGFLYFAHGMDVDGELLAVEALQVVTGDDDVAEA